MVDGDSSLLELFRSIHLNPLRAAMVPNPDGYPWPNHPAYLGMDDLPLSTAEDLLGNSVDGLALI